MPRHPANRARAWVRVAWALGTLIVVETLVCGLAALPIVLGWRAIGAWVPLERGWGPALIALALVPSYAGFALLLMIVSAGATRILGWRTPADAAMRIVDFDWPLLTWVRYVASGRVVRVLAGGLYCGSPVWSLYVRLNGARMGRRVWLNTVDLADHNLLEFGDDVVVGADVHLSGHTVEGGVVKTGRVRLGAGVTVGLESAIDIDVEAGAGCQIGALAFVPKHSRLEAGRVYVGIPVRPLD